ncbi:MAG: hypothetical protein ABR571_15440 [Jatrophihabitans sp.]|uniref:hypothetical protein n=1 Tax=Jatrophihabitans sp. TaxID=1932789 RepID=UPI003913159F
MRSRAVALLCAAALATGCSSKGSDSALSDSAAATLHSDVLALTRAAAARNWSAADGALTELRSDLTAARALGTVSDARAAAIEATIRSVAADLALRSGRTATPPSTPSSSTASSPGPSATRTTANQPAPAPPGPGGSKDDKGPGKKHKH